MILRFTETKVNCDSSLIFVALNLKKIYPPDYPY